MIHPDGRLRKGFLRARADSRSEAARRPIPLRGSGDRHYSRSGDRRYRFSLRVRIAGKPGQVVRKKTPAGHGGCGGRFLVCELALLRGTHVIAFLEAGA